jgi:hypothetical protein
LSIPWKKVTDKGGAINLGVEGHIIAAIFAHYADLAEFYQLNGKLIFSIFSVFMTYLKTK